MTIPRETHPCAVCQRSARKGHLMCPHCWRVVPKPLQVDVWRTWRAFERRKSPRDGLSTLAAYRNACTAAVAAVPSPEQQPKGRP